MARTAPVTDWATDFDVLDPSYVEDPFSIWSTLRASCPIAHTDRRGSNWLPTRYEDVTEIAHDIEHFSSLKVAVIPFAGDEPPPDRVLEHGLPPISADPPLHTWTRRLLLPWFSHNRVATYEPFTRELCAAATRPSGSSRTRRCRGAVLTADPRPGDRQDPRRVGGPVGHLHGLGPRRARVRGRSGPPGTRGPGAYRLLPGSGQTEARSSPATTC